MTGSSSPISSPSTIPCNSPPNTPPNSEQWRKGASSYAIGLLLLGPDIPRSHKLHRHTCALRAVSMLMNILSGRAGKG